MLFKSSYKPLKKVKIIREIIPMHNGACEVLLTMYNAYNYAICDGVEKLDTRMPTMFDICVGKLRRRLAKEGYAVAGEA